MNARNFAMISGIIYVIVGIAGFILALLQPFEADAPPLAVNTLAGRLLGLFPVNVLHTVVHLLIGIRGVIAAKSMGAAIGYAKGLAIIYALLTIMGLIPGLNNVFGPIPLHSHDVWLHAGTALIAAYFGFSSKSAAHRT